MAQLEHLGEPEERTSLPPLPERPTSPNRVRQPGEAIHPDSERAARRVEQAVLRVDPNSVLRLSLRFFMRLVIIGLLLGGLFWAGTFVTGTAGSIDSFLQQLTGYPSLTVLGFQGLLLALVLGVTFVLGSALLAVLAAVLFNLASDIVGGIRMTVVETELDGGLLDGPLLDEGRSAPVAQPRSVGSRAAADRSRGAAHRRPVLGADVTSLTPAGAAATSTHRGSGTPKVLRGALVVGVEPDSPAQSAGLEEGDVIVSLDGTAVDSPASLSSAIGAHDAHGGFDISWVDDRGRYHTAIVHLGDRSDRGTGRRPPLSNG